MLIVWEQNGISGQQLIAGAVLKADQYSQQITVPPIPPLLSASTSFAETEDLVVWPIHDIFQV